MVSIQLVIHVPLAHLPEYLGLNLALPFIVCVNLGNLLKLSACIGKWKLNNHYLSGLV